MSGVQKMAAQARRHWKEFLPEKTRQLIAAGTYSEETMKAAREAQQVIRRLMQQGYQEHEAEEVALPRYILLPPEAGAENGVEDEIDKELAEMERQFQEYPPLILY